MVTYVKSDLEFILKQIEIAEQLEAGVDVATLIPHYSLPYGLREVDGRNNNLLHTEFGAADTAFPRIVPVNPLNLEPSNLTFDSNGPAPGGLVTNSDYGQNGNVVDSDPRTISNLIVDQTLNNPAAIAAALKVAGSENILAETQAIVGAMQDLAEAREAAAASSAAQVAALLQILTDLQTDLPALQLVAQDAVDAELIAQGQFDQALLDRDNAEIAYDASIVTLNTLIANGAPIAEIIAAANESVLRDQERDAAQIVLDQETTQLADAEGLVTSTAAAVTSQLALIADAQENYDAAVLAEVNGDANVIAAEEALAALVNDAGIMGPNGNLVITNVATDEGLSASFNSWFTLFGQFFDHGLDLVTKGGNGTVFIPLLPDDPLITHGPDGIAGTGDEVTDPAFQFMALTRATPDGDSHTNTTTSWVDQNQTYTSHASHQVFLREYAVNGAGDTVSTGRLLEGVNGGPATWAQVKAQASDLLGINLTDADVGNVPLLRTDAYGKFIPGLNGYAQVITGAGLDGEFNTSDDDVIEGDPLANGGDGISLATAVRIGHAFLDDIAHTAGPVFIDHDNNPLTPRELAPDADTDTGNAVATNPQTGQRLEYDDELLDAHKITGDGRGNENIGLTTVHHVFHSEHNRLVDHTKEVAVASAIELGGDAGLAFLNAWLDSASPATALPGTQAEIDALIWNGERIFQAAKFGTEMQYQHLVFEEFARKVQPLTNLFGPYNAEIDPSIVAEFAHVVYRFGHSMLNEDVAIMNPDGTTNDVGLIAAFLNPVMFDNLGDAETAAGAIIRGMTRQTGNEIDEFVTTALRNNLLGIPLDLAVLNIARARDTGSPSLNEARAQFYAGTGDEQLKPYESWVDFALHSKNELSVINFIAAYGKHDALTAADVDTLVEKRAIATALVMGGTVILNEGTLEQREFNADGPGVNRFDFLNSTGTWNAENSGLNDVDFWIGGLAEAQQPFGGLLGSSFNFVFETQMENLQDGDRFYYLARLAGTHFLTELEGNSFAQMIINNTNIGEDGMHLPGDIFSVPNWILEVNQNVQVTGIFRPNQLDGDGNPLPGEVGREDPTGDSIFTPLVVRDGDYLKYTGGDHVVLGGTDDNNTLIAGIGDDTIWGDGGNDRIEGGAGVDQLIGGSGDDIITDINGDDNIKGGTGNDVVNSGDGFDLILLGDGDDFSVGGEDANETFGGAGDDYIIGGDDADTVFGDEGDDWIEGGTGNDLLQGDFGAPFQDSAHVGNDIIMGGAGNDDYDSETGDDIMLADDGIERSEGMLGFDWVTYKNDARAANADMAFTGLLPPDLDAIRDRFDMVEGLSGWDLNDTLRGDDSDTALLSNIDVASGQNNALNNQAQIDLISGLQDLLGAGVTSFSGGNIILGGGGSDIIEGRGGNDIIDGDAKLNVRLSIVQNLDGTGPEIGTADGMTTPISSSNPLINGKSLVELMFNGTLNPGQLNIVREIITDDTSGVDMAVYSGNAAEYEVMIDDNGTAGDLSDDVVTVAHRLLDGNGAIIAGSAGADGTDTLRHIEIVRFADGAQILDPNITNQGATGNLAIIDGGAPGITIGEPLTVAIGSVQDPDNVGGVVALSAITLTWQVEANPEEAPGVWTDLVDPVTEAPVTGPTFTPTAGFEIDGLRLRVSGTFVGANGIPETVTSTPTDPVAPATVTVATAGDDNLVGTNGDDFIDPLAGDDIVNGLAGNDTIIGGDGDGNDILNGGTDTGANLGDVAVFFGSIAGATPDFVFSLNAEGVLEVVSTGLPEEDAINTIENLIFIDGPGLSDVELADLVNQVRANPPADGVATVFGGQTVTVRLVAGILDGEVINGGAGADTLVGGDWNDTITGGGGDDVIEGGIGNDTIIGDGTPGLAGDDTISWRVGEGRDLIDGGGNATVTGDVFDVRGSGNGDTFTVYSLAAAVLAGLGPFTATTEVIVTRQEVGGPVEIVAELDNIESLVINNVAIAPGVTTAGGDTVAVVGDLVGTSLNPNLPPTGMDIFDLEGGDNLRVAENVAGAIIGSAIVHDVTVGDTHTFEITRLGENGVEVAEDRFEIVDGDLATAGQQLVFKLKAGASINFEEDQRIDLVVRTFDSAGNGSTNNPYDYTIRALDVRETVAGTTGDIGDDDIHGGSGKDHIVGGRGADRAWGGGGDDRFVTTTGDGNDWYNGGSGSDTYDASAATGDIDINLLTGSATGTGIGIDKLYGIEHAWGGSGDNTMTGNSSNNSLRGGAGTDTINGNSGNDSLNGGSGQDTLNGGTGSDRLTGGEGSDKFVFNSGFGNDVIMDFDANAAGGQDKLDLSALGISSANFDARVDIIDKGSDVIVRIDDANTIKLKDVSNVGDITMNDFVLFGG